MKGLVDSLSPNRSVASPCDQLRKLSRAGAVLPGGVPAGRVLAVVVGVIFAALSCRGGTDLLSINVWDRYDAATPASASQEEFSQLSLAAETLGTPSQVSPLAAPVEDLFKKNYWYLVVLDVKEVFTAPARWDTRDWLLFGGVAAGIGTVAVFDEDIQHAIQSHRNNTVKDIFDGVEPLGNEYAIGVVGAFYVYGEFFKDPRAKSTALDAISASAIASGIVTNSLKYVIGRSRPIDHEGAYHFQPFSGRDSFSSGHTSEAFALASVISEHYPSLWVQFTSYGLASMVGYARLMDDRHWTSDVLAGAAIGTFVGKTVVHFNQRHRNISLRPIVGPDIHGAEISIAW